MAAKNNIAPDEALKIAQTLVHNVEALGIEHSYAGHRSMVTVSCGVYCRQVGKTDKGEEYIMQADNAVYQAKRQRGNQVCCIRQ